MDFLICIKHIRKEKCSMDVVKDEIINELNWKERIVVKLFAKTFEKVYNKCRIKIVNSIING